MKQQALKISIRHTKNFHYIILKKGSRVCYSLKRNKKTNEMTWDIKMCSSCETKYSEKPIKIAENAGATIKWSCTKCGNSLN